LRGRSARTLETGFAQSIWGAKGAIVTDLQQDAPSVPPAGWYPDPVRPGSTRYWSGTGWTDQVSAPVTEQYAAPSAVASAAPSLGYLFDAGPVVEPPPAMFGAPPPPTERHASQEEWHQTRARPIQRTSVPPVSSTTRAASSKTARSNDPYDRNWIAGVAIVLAILSIPALALRVLWDLPPLTQSILAGAPIGISLLAFARAARGRSGLVLSIIAVVISAGTLVAAWFVDPALIQSVVDAVVGLIPA
jgi:hypothetical protein